jgi:hypothetical protein
VNNVVGGPIAKIGTAVYNGDGTCGLIRNTRNANGEIRQWADTALNGSYTVDPDCTGSLFEADGTHSNNIVVLDGGKQLFLLSVAQRISISTPRKARSRYGALDQAIIGRAIEAPRIQIDVSSLGAAQCSTAVACLRAVAEHARGGAAPKVRFADPHYVGLLISDKQSGEFQRELTHLRVE